MRPFFVALGGIAITNTLPIFSYTSHHFLKICDLLSCFLHQGGYKRLNYIVQRSLLAIPFSLTTDVCMRKISNVYKEQTT
jgi:hypothetical protein